MIGKWIRRLLPFTQDKPSFPLITTVINYCTNDYQFIRECIEQASLFSHEILVPYTGFFFDGTKENAELLNQTILENPKARFIHFDFDPTRKVNTLYWVAFARFFGWKNSSSTTDFILFLDADEIVDGIEFVDWLKVYPLHRLNAVRPANYWYFRETRFQALTYEDSAVLVRKKLLRESMIMDFNDRTNVFSEIQEPKQQMVLGDHSKPMIHHYSWVRTKEGMLQKIKTLKPVGDRDWIALVEQEFSHDFTGRDFVKGYKFKTVRPFII
jgi:hypothetical protein